MPPGTSRLVQQLSLDEPHSLVPEPLVGQLGGAASPVPASSIVESGPASIAADPSCVGPSLAPSAGPGSAAFVSPSALPGSASASPGLSPAFSIVASGVAASDASWLGSWLASASPTPLLLFEPHLAIASIHTIATSLCLSIDRTPFRLRADAWATTHPTLTAYSWSDRVSMGHRSIGGDRKPLPSEATDVLLIRIAAHSSIAHGQGPLTRPSRRIRARM